MKTIKERNEYIISWFPGTDDWGREGMKQKTKTCRLRKPRLEDGDQKAEVGG